MRIQKNIICDGIFWLPESSEIFVSGVLYIKDGGEIELILNNDELWDRNIKDISFDEYLNFSFNCGEYEIINGKIEDCKHITLIQCYHKTTNEINVNTALERNPS